MTFPDYENFKKALPVDFAGMLTSNWVSPYTGVAYPVATYCKVVYDLDKEKFEAKRRAAAKAWSDAQRSASSKAELSELKAAQSYQKSLEAAKAARKAALAAAARSSAQQGHLAAIKAQTSEIKANTARNISAQENPVEFAQGMPAEVKQDVQDAAQASQENAKMQEEINYLPEVQVKSDFSKYLLWGGVAVLAFYLLKKKKRV